MIVSKKVSFCAAHHLPTHNGKCHDLHGHTWTLELAVQGQIMEEHGFVVDFSRIKDWLQEHVIGIFDHKLINNVLENPTAENIVNYVREEFNHTGYEISGDVKLAYIRLWETENSMVEHKEI